MTSSVKTRTANGRRGGVEVRDPNRPPQPTIQTKLMAVTPEVAATWLSESSKWAQKNNTRINRTASSGHIDNMAFDMSVPGNWLDTGVPIVIDVNGVVRDGQQRLSAIIKSGKTLWFNVVFGVEPAAQRAIDKGRRRSVSDDLHIAGVPSSKHMTATATLLLAWEAGRIMRQQALTTSAVVFQYVTNNQEGMLDAVNLAGRVRVRLSRMTVSVCAAAAFKAAQINSEACEEFFGALQEGASLSVDNPIFVLRETIYRYDRLPHKPRREAQLYQVVHAWNLWRAGKSAKFLRVPARLTSETFPGMK